MTQPLPLREHFLLWTWTKIGILWTTYLPQVCHVVFGWPLTVLNVTNVTVGVGRGSKKDQNIVNVVSEWLHIYFITPNLYLQRTSNIHVVCVTMFIYSYTMGPNLLCRLLWNNQRCFLSKETTYVTVTRGTLWSDKV